MNPKPSLASLSIAGSNQFPVTDTAPQSLGKVSHGLDADSAVERLCAESSKKSCDELPFAYPFHLLSTAHEAIDTAFREAFSGQLSTESPELERQARETARHCMAEMLSGNEIMRLSPDTMVEIEHSLRDIVQHVTREAIKLERAGHKKHGKCYVQTPEIRNQIRHQIASQKPVQDFKNRFFGWAASVDKQRESGQQQGKETQ